MLLSAAHREALSHFHRDGVALLHDVISPAQLATLRRACSELVGAVDAQIDAGGGDLVRPLTHKSQRYFIDFTVDRQPAIHAELIDSELMAELCRSVFPRESHGALFHHKQQFVVKCPQAEMEFNWHQDSGYMWGAEHTPWVTFWVALDDMRVQNGTLYTLPHGRAYPGLDIPAAVGTLAAVKPHELATDGTNDLIGYSGDDQGDPVIMDAGGMAIFSRCLHTYTRPFL